MDILGEIRSYWDVDAQTYDLAPQHHPRDPLVQAAWTTALERALPDHPVRVLDCGAGTGFLSLIAARLGHRVTALDLAPAMLERLVAAADRDGLSIEVITGRADEPPGHFDVVMERHLLWTLPDPQAALAAWRVAASDGRLVLVESLWGDVDPFERIRSRARAVVARWRGTLPEHHSEYEDAVRAELPLGGGVGPSPLLDLVAAAGWRTPRVTRLRDVEWAERRVLPVPERVIGLPPRFVVVADA
jgi:SAM-dependent methyltransferase